MASGASPSSGTSAPSSSPGRPTTPTPPCRDSWTSPARSPGPRLCPAIYRWPSPGPAVRPAVITPESRSPCARPQEDPVPTGSANREWRGMFSLSVGGYCSVAPAASARWWASSSPTTPSPNADLFPYWGSSVDRTLIFKNPMASPSPRTTCWLADASPVLRVDLCQRQQPELVRVTKRRNRQPVKRRTEQQEVLRPACASTASIGIEVVAVSKLFLSFGTAVSEQLLG
ncbi:hypothetical protein EV648_109190 [Kribbella sp. VKM Ac-2568]|nr:hypothetical protein EV648_109190 [Kribbella sp. VKM Ac-2568]